MANDFYQKLLTWALPAKKISMKLVLELTESQLNQLQIYVYRGKLEAQDEMHEYLEECQEEDRQLWGRIRDKRVEVWDIIESAIEDQEGMGGEEEE